MSPNSNYISLTSTIAPINDFDALQALKPMLRRRNLLRDKEVQTDLIRSESMAWFAWSSLPEQDDCLPSTVISQI